MKAYDDQKRSLEYFLRKYNIDSKKSPQKMVQKMSERRNDNMDRLCYSEDDIKILQSADLDK